MTPHGHSELWKLKELKQVWSCVEGGVGSTVYTALTDGEMGGPARHRVIHMILRAFPHPTHSYQNFLHPCLPISPWTRCGPGTQGFGLPTLRFCANIIVTRRGKTHIFQEDFQDWSLSLASSLHNFFSTAVSDLFVSQYGYLCHQNGESFMVCCLQESGRRQFFFIMMSN